EGYVKHNGSGQFMYVYQYKDHLGNVRLSYADIDGSETIDSASEILEENNYYPFGLKHQGYNEIANNNRSEAAEKYKYSGKEWNDELGLDLYDFHARNYDPAIGRWLNIDPLAEKAPGWTPYNYTMNNPINLIDPDGRFPIAPLLWWAGKRAVAGAVVDIGVQLLQEWVERGGSIGQAWNRLDIDEWQVARSAGENLVKGKYTSAAISAAGDMVSYMENNEDWTWEGAFKQAGYGALSSIVGDKLAGTFARRFGDASISAKQIFSGG